MQAVALRRKIRIVQRPAINTFRANHVIGYEAVHEDPFLIVGNIIVFVREELIYVMRSPAAAAKVQGSKPAHLPGLIRQRGRIVDARPECKAATEKNGLGIDARGTRICVSHAVVDILLVDAAVGNDGISTVINSIARLGNLPMRYGRNIFYSISISIVELVHGAAEIAALDNGRFFEKKAVNHFHHRKRHQQGEAETKEGAPEFSFAGDSFKKEK